MSITPKGEIIKEYIEQRPEMPKLSLAKLIYSNHSDLFTSVESVRTLIRAYKGSMGKKMRKEMKHHGLQTPLASEYKSKFGFIEGIDEGKEYFEIPDKPLGIITDPHPPFHDVEACDKALERVKDCDQLLINGDVWDFYWTSRFIKDPRLRVKVMNTAHEREIVYRFLATIRENFDGPIYYKFGNHEDRWEKYLMTKAEELLGFQEFELVNILRLGELHIQPIKSSTLINYDDFLILHGHEHLGSGDPKYVAKNRLKKVQLTEKEENIKIISGHNHRTEHHIEPTINGGEAESWVIGCLCGLSPEYMPHNRWNHGCMTIDRGKVDNIRL